MVMVPLQHLNNDINQLEMEYEYNDCISIYVITITYINIIAIFYISIKHDITAFILFLLLLPTVPLQSFAAHYILICVYKLLYINIIYILYIYINILYG